MKPGRWFLPEEPDITGLLRAQIAVTLEGLEAFATWARGDSAAGRLVREAEPRGDLRKRELVNALRAAFVIPLEPEDVFALSRGIDLILDFARDLVAEADVLDQAPDAGIAEMAELMGTLSGASMRRSQRSAAMTRLRTQPPRRRSRSSTGSAMPTTAAWRTCSRSGTCARGSSFASSTGAVPGSAR